MKFLQIIAAGVVLTQTNAVDLSESPEDAELYHDLLKSYARFANELGLFKEYDENVIECMLGRKFGEREQTQECRKLKIAVTNRLLGDAEIQSDLDNIYVRFANELGLFKGMDDLAIACMQGNNLSHEEHEHDKQCRKLKIAVTDRLDGKF